MPSGHAPTFRMSFKPCLISYETYIYKLANTLGHSLEYFCREIGSAKVQISELVVNVCVFASVTRRMRVLRPGQRLDG